MRILWILLAAVCIAGPAMCQLTATDESRNFVNQYKRLWKKADVCIPKSSIVYTFREERDKNKKPIVAVTEVGEVEMLTLQHNTSPVYPIYVNSFVALKNMQLKWRGPKGFVTVPLLPKKFAITDENIFLDDNAQMLYPLAPVEMGVNVKIDYARSYEDARYFSRVFFANMNPVADLKYEFRVPDWLTVDLIEKNFEGSGIKKTTVPGKGYTSHIYQATKLNAFKSEANSVAAAAFAPHLVISIRSFQANKQEIPVFKDVGGLYSFYKGLYDDCENDNSKLKAQVAALTAGKNSNQEKLKAIYYWVQDNIRYIAFEDGYAGFVPQTVQEVYTNKYGDCKGMANLVTEMIKMAGMDAHFAWVGTRDIPYNHYDVQSLCVDNHAISVVYMDGKPFFVDGTEKYAALGNDAFRIQGKTVLVEHGDKYKIEKVPLVPQESNVMQTKAALELKGDKISGRVAVSFTGEAKNYFHNIYNAVPANKRTEFLESLVELGDDNITSTNIKYSDFDNRDIPITLEGDIEIANGVTYAEKNGYFGIDFEPNSLRGYLPEPDRESPIDMKFVVYKKDDITLKLPAGVKPLSIPKPARYEFQNNLFEASYKTDNNSITLNKVFSITSPIVQPEAFTGLRQFIADIKSFNRNKISVQLP